LGFKSCELLQDTMIIREARSAIKIWLFIDPVFFLR